jgi:hypothetical protein
MLSFTSLFMIPLLAVVATIVITVNAIIQFINAVFGTSINKIDFDNDPSTGPFKEFNNWKNKIINTIIGCGRKHPSPLVRDYAENVCGKCKLKFSSSIFNEPSSDYFNACYHNAPVDKGVEDTNTSSFWVDKNKPLLNGILFFDQLKNTFNGEWRISNGVLTFERRDFFKPVKTWVDLTAMESDKYDICYSWGKKTRPSYGVFEYAQEAINTISNEAKFRYGDIVEWNQPVLPGQKGEFKPLIPFSACRFRDDHVRLSDGPERDVLTTYRNAPFIGSKIQQWDNVVLLNQHICFNPMLIIWDGQSRLDARASGTQFGQFTNNSEATPGEFYNYPLWFDATVAGNMYTNFWFIEDPRTQNFQNKTYDATIEMTCDLINSANLDDGINTPEGFGKIDEIVFDYKNKKIRIKGEI